MGDIVLAGATSGTITLQPTAVAGSNTLTLPASTGTLALYAAPQVTVYSSGSGTYTVPSGAKYLYIKMVGAGGGGSGSARETGTAGGTGGNGGNTTFGSSFLTANGGTGGTWGNPAGNGGAGGSASIGAGAAGIVISGPFGGASNYNFNSSIALAGGAGGNSPLGAGGPGGFYGSGGFNGQPGGGGGGGGIDRFNGCSTGTGGGAGGYVEAYITSLSASYSYAVGAGGAGGTAGASGNTGGAGGAGLIIVTAFFG